MKYLQKISLILSLFMLFSCYESLDVNQLDDYVSKPVFTAALTYFTVVPAKFFDSSGTIQENSISDISDFKPFENSTVRNNVVKMIFNAELKNEFDRDVTIQVEFLDDNDISIYSFVPIFVESEDVKPPPYEEEIIIASNPNILNATQVKLTAELENTGTQMNPSDTSEFEFKSSITIFLESEF